MGDVSLGTHADGPTSDLGAHVAIVRWPEDEAHVAALRAAGTPRLLLVAPDVPAPTCTECDEDWIRLPATDDDIKVRSAAVASRAARHVPHPEVAGDGRITFRGSWEALSRIEEAFASELAERMGQVVSTKELIARCGDDEMSANAVRVHVMRLRKRLDGLGLVVRTVHGRGYVLEIAR